MAFKKKETTSTEVFVLTLPLRCEPWQRDRLDTVFRCCNSTKNALIAKKLRALKQLERTVAWKSIKAEMATVYAEVKDHEPTNAQMQKLRPLFRQSNQLLAQHGITKAAFERDVKHIAKHFGKNVHSQVAQKLSYDVWNGFERYLFGNGETIRFSAIGEFSSIEGKSNLTGIRYSGGYLLYGKLKLQVSFSKKDPYDYEHQAMLRTIHYCRLTRRWYPDGWRYFAQFVLSGKPPIKVKPKTGELLHLMGTGRVGLDIGPQTLAAVGDHNAELVVLAEQVQDIQSKLRRIIRAMDRSRRAANPKMFKPNGSVIPVDKLPSECIMQKNGKPRRLWKESKRYAQLKSTRKYLLRSQADLRRQQHNQLVNQILAMGDDFFIETMQFSALAKRSKVAKTNTQGKNLSRKRFGKSIANKAPAMFVNILERKVRDAGGEFHHVNTVKAKASQYDHSTGTYKKKKLSQRWHQLADGTKVQRDLYSAFLLQNTNATLDGFVQGQLNEKYANFKSMHDTEIERLKQRTNPSSTGVRKSA